MILIVDHDDLEAAEEYSISKPAPASSEFIELVNLIMIEDEIEVSSRWRTIIFYIYIWTFKITTTIVHNR